MSGRLGLDCCARLMAALTSEIRSARARHRLEPGRVGPKTSDFENIRAISTTLVRLRPFGPKTPADLWSMSTKFLRVPLALARFRPKVDWIRPNLGHFARGGPRLVKGGWPGSAEFGQRRRRCGNTWPRFDKIGAMLAELGKFHCIGQKFAEFGSCLTGCGRCGPMSFGSSLRAARGSLCLDMPNSSLESCT